MFFTAAHELTHFIKQWSPDKFKVLANFLVQQYGDKDISVSKLFREQQNKAKRNGRTISYDTAYEEVVADSMEMMLSDGNVMKRLEKLKAQDKDLWSQIKRFVDNMAAKIREVYKGLKPDSKEAELVKEMGDTIYRLQELFAEGLVEASENFQTAEKNTTEDGGVRFMSREDSSRIKDQIVAVSDLLNKMDVVTSVTTDGFAGMKKSDIAKAVEKEYTKFGKRVDRQNFGIILLEFPQINKVLEYLNTDGEKAALLTVPRVLKRGIIADSHTEHKERGVDSITFAAPVEINGQRGNVGVVVQRVSGTNRFKTLRILLTNGKAFEFVKNKEADPTTGSSSKHNGLEGVPIESASKFSIRDDSGKVNEKTAEAVDEFVSEYKDSHKGVMYSDRDSDGNELSKGQQEFFKDSQARDENGSLVPVYHTSPTAGFYTFEGEKGEPRHTSMN